MKLKHGFKTILQRSEREAMHIRKRTQNTKWRIPYSITLPWVCQERFQRSAKVTTMCSSLVTIYANERWYNQYLTRRLKHVLGKKFRVRVFQKCMYYQALCMNYQAFWTSPKYPQSETFNSTYQERRWRRLEELEWAVQLTFFWWNIDRRFMMQT